MYIQRDITQDFQRVLASETSILLLGPRQAGKTTFLKQFTPDLALNLLDPSVRQAYERRPELLKQAILALPKQNKKPFVIIDEIQKIPVLMDVAQDCIDAGLAYFILTGSSARKLRRHSVNFLPGRVVHFYLDPFSMNEYESPLMDSLVYGNLPGIVLEPSLELKERKLDAYGISYLEEEVRAEALVRELSLFSRFLELAASEAGHIVNLTKLSREIGVSHHTINEYYSILTDSFVAYRIDPFLSAKTRRQLVHSPKYLFFDLGLRRLAAREGLNPSQHICGHLFEQWVGLELLKHFHNQIPEPRLFFWRDKTGLEVDYVVEIEKKLIPIEVKWAENIHDTDLKSLKIFMKEYACEKGYVICRAPLPMQLTSEITALPWQQLLSIKAPSQN